MTARRGRGARSTVAKKSAAKKPVAKKSAAKKPAAKKSVAKKPAAKKPAAKKSAAKKPAAKKPVAKKSAAKAAAGRGTAASAPAPIQTHGKPFASALPELHVVGTRGQRVDALPKVDGSARYIDDITFPDMLYAAVRSSDEPQAEVLRIDVTDAQQVPGVVAVATFRDIPGENQVGCVRPDQPLLVETRARWLGDRVALVAAADPATAQAAARAVKVELEPLPGVFDVEHAVGAAAALVHPDGNVIDAFHVACGDVDRAFADADVVVEHRYVAPWQEHAYLETQGVIAVPEGGGMVLYGSMQCPFYVQGAVARVLGLPLARVRVVQTTTGGAFGGKEDYPSEPACCAALLAHKSGQPVKLVYNREQDIHWSSKRHRMVIQHRLAARQDGTVTAADIDILVDAGAYCGLSGVVAERANQSAVGPYVIPNTRVRTRTVYTNNPFGGAFRGFGAPQVALAHEGQMDALATQLRRDPLELRRQNGVRAGSLTGWGESLAPPVEYLDTLDEAARLAEWAQLRARAEAHNRAGRRTRLGVGIGTCMYGCCLHAGGQHLEGAGALLQVHRDGSITVAHGLTEMGQGASTIAARLAAEVLGVDSARVSVIPADTALVPDSGPTVASRTTTMAGHAVVDAAQQVRAGLARVAAQLLGCDADQLVFARGVVHGSGKARLSFEELVAEAYRRKAHLAASGWYTPPHKVHDRATGLGQPYSAYAYATHIVLVEVDMVTGQVWARHFYCAHDVGRAIYPDGVLGQIEGGVVQGMGYALSERLVVDGGRILNPNFTDYLIPTISDMPAIDIALIETGDIGGDKGDGTSVQAKGPYGAKGIGEPSLIPAPAAIASAVSHALEARLTTLPLTPDTVMLEIEARDLDQVPFVEVTATTS